MVIAEDDILSNLFINRVYDIKQIPVNAKDFERSQKGIMRQVYALQRQLKKTNSLSDRSGILQKISKLKAIENDLQKALEI